MTVKWSDNTAFPIVGSIANDDYAVGLFSLNNGKTLMSTLKAYTNTDVGELTAQDAAINSLVVGDATSIGLPENGLLRMNGSLFEYYNGTTWINPLARANHTGTQLASTISDFSTEVLASVGKANQAVGYTLAGGTSSKTLTLSEDCTINQSLSTTSAVTFASQTLSTNSTIAGTQYIGVGSIASCAALQVDVTTKGWLKPRVTTTQKNNIPSPVEGLEVWDTVLKANCVYNGTAWVTETTGGGSITGSANQIGYYSGTNTLGGSNDFYFDLASKRMSINAAGSFGAVSSGGGLLIINDATTSSDKMIAQLVTSAPTGYGTMLRLANLSGTSAKNILSFSGSGEVAQFGNDYNGDGTANLWMKIAGSLVFAIDANGCINNSQIIGNTSAVMDLRSTSKGFYKPRMSTTNRNIMPAPASGCEIYDNTIHKPSFYALSAWKYNAVESGTTIAAGYIPFYDSSSYLDVANTFQYDSTNKRLGVGSTSAPSYALDVLSSATVGVITARFGANPGGTGSTNFNSIILNNAHATNRKNQISFAGNGTIRYALYNDINGAGAQNFGLFDNNQGQTIWEVDNTLAFYPGADGTQDLGKLAQRWRTGYATSASFNTSDTRRKTDIKYTIPEILGSSQYSILGTCGDLFNAAKAFSDAVIRYKLEDELEESGYSQYDSLGFRADVLYKLGFTGAAAFKKDNTRVKFCDQPKDEEIYIYMMDQTQMVAFNTLTISELIKRVEALEAQVIH